MSRLPSEAPQPPSISPRCPCWKGVSGKYFVDRREARSSHASYDRAAALGLWELSERMTGLCDPSFLDRAGDRP